MRITNINGTSDNTCSCGGWLNHWKNFSRQSVPTSCPEKNCPKKSEVGAHVQKSGYGNWYIAPLCADHNRQTGSSLEINDSVALVSANVSETCGQ